jgi:hypothetical protein
LITLKNLDWSVAILGFPDGRVTLLIGVEIDWFTLVSHIVYADIVIGDLDKELWKHLNTSGVS